MKWKIKNGETVLIKDMDDNHLLNTARFIERNTEKYVSQTQDFYLLCVPPNGQMAQDCFDREFDEVMEMSTGELLDRNKSYKEMVSEIKKRKLNFTSITEE